MDMSEVKSFNAELSALYDNKPPISKAKMSAITKGAIKAIKFYKHVVHSVEKFIQKCKPEYKVPGLYVIDSIVRQSRHQFGQDKDVFAPRFAKNMQQTFANLFRCPPEDKRNIIRVLNLWQKNNVFSSEVIQPLLDMADPNHPLHQEIQHQNNNANGNTLNVSHNTGDKISPVAQQHTPHASTPMGDQFQDQPSSAPSGVKFNRKLLNDFEYDSEDDGGASMQEPPPTHPSHSGHSASANLTLNAAQNPAEALGSILTNPEIMRQLQSLQAQMQLMTGMQIPNLMPMMSDMQLQQSQNQNMSGMGSQQEQQKMNDSRDEMAESDIEFVDAGPQVIEIPDANDSRSPSPVSRRRSKSPRRRRRSTSRSRSPRRRRDRDRDTDRHRDRDRDKEREKDREKSYKEREAEKEKQREREKKGLPPIKKENLSVCSTTLWVGHLSKLATQEELSDLFGEVGGVVSIDVVPPRGCAFVVMERRRDAAKALEKLNKYKLHSKEITVAWAPGKGVKGREWKDYWEAELGVSYLPWSALHARWVLGALSLDALEDGGAVDEDTLPPWMPPRIIPKTVMDNMSLLGMPGPNPALMPNMPPAGMPNMPPNIPNNLQNSMPPNMSSTLPGSLAGPMPGNLPGNIPGGLQVNMPGGLPTNLQGSIPVSIAAGMPASMSMAGAPPTSLPMPMPGMPPPGMTAGMPPGMTPGMPPGMRPTGIPGLQGEAGLPPRGPLLGFPPGLPPQSLPQPGMMGGFLGGLLGVGGLVGGVPLPMAMRQHQQLQIPQQAPRQNEVTHTDDAMDLDTEDAHGEESNNGDVKTDGSAPAFLPDQIQALLSKPPPSFNVSEPPPGFNASEPPPFNKPPPTEEKHEKHEGDKGIKNDRDRDRRQSDRERDRDRDRDRRDRDRREDKRGDRRERDRDRGRDRERDKERDDRRDRERDDRRDRDRDRGRDRRDRDRDRDRYSSKDNSGRNRDKSPRNPNMDPNEKPTLQERLWEMANGKPNRSETEKPVENYQETEQYEQEDYQRGAEEYQENKDYDDKGDSYRDESRNDEERDRSTERGKTSERDNDKTTDNSIESGWTQLAPPRMPLPGPGHLLPPGFRAELRMRGPPRPPMRGPWMDGSSPGPFGPRFSGMGPPFRPPFDRPPFEGGPLFDGPRPPFNRMPFDGPNRPPFDGSIRPPFDGPIRPPFDGPIRPPFDGPNRPLFDGPPPFDGSNRPPFDGPPPRFDGPRPPFDGPRPHFDGPRISFDGPRPPFDGPRPPFDGHRPPFEGSRPGFDGPRAPFDGPPRQFERQTEFFDRQNRRFDDRDQYNDRNWNDEEHDRRNDWDDKRRDKRSREHEDRFRERNDRRRNYEDRNEKGDRNERGDRNEKGDRNERGDRNEKGDRSERGDRNDRGDRNERVDRNERGDKNEKMDRTDKSDKSKQKDERISRRDNRKSRWGTADESADNTEIQEENNKLDQLNSAYPNQEDIMDIMKSDQNDQNTIKDASEEKHSKSEYEQNNDALSSNSSTIDTQPNLIEPKQIENENNEIVPTLNPSSNCNNIANETTLGLYDANDIVVDTSFASQLPFEKFITSDSELVIDKETENPLCVNEPAPNPVTESVLTDTSDLKSHDIFNQENTDNTDIESTGLSEIQTNTANENLEAV